MATVYEFPGDGITPAALHDQLSEAGVDVLGVTFNEDELTVQVICEDGQPKGPVTKAVKAYEHPDVLAPARAAKQAEIVAALAASDQWVARAYEAGEPVADDKKAYRQKLRDLYGKAGKAKSADAIAALELPAVPA